jgi:uncharacterized cupredoxin-like copper-binding protein
MLILRRKKMTFTRRTAIALLGCTLIGFSVGPALAAGSIVQVSLWDKGGTSMNMMGRVKPMGMAMMGSDMSMVTMGITTDLAEVPAGEVTFQVTNDSKDMIHEMVLAPVSDVSKPLPYISNEAKVDEDAAGHLGEVAELEIGQSGALTMTLKPGTYILYCNIQGHYAMGMWTIFNVTS